jgi:hypothetical protein
MHNGARCTSEHTSQQKSAETEPCQAMRPCSCQRHEDRLEIGRGYITCCGDIEEEEAIGGSCRSHENLHTRAYENGSIRE